MAIDCSRAPAQSAALAAAADEAALAHAQDAPVLLVDITSLSRGAVILKDGQREDELEQAQQQLMQRLLQHLSHARDFDSQCEVFLYQHSFCRWTTTASLARDRRSYAQSLPLSHVVAPLPFPPLLSGVSSQLMHSCICRPSPYSIVTLIKQLLKQCLRPLHWKYSCCLELELMAAQCAAAAAQCAAAAAQCAAAGARPAPASDALPDFQLISPSSLPRITRHTSHTLPFTLEK
jgi:hypothetical protein